MRPIKLYFAGAWSGVCNEEEVNLGIKNKLVSYMYPQQLESWLKVAKNQKGNIIVDSGAFSAWSKGDKIDLGKYIEYAHKAIQDGKAQGKEVRIVNLDVIPGKKGETKTLQNFTNTKNTDLVEQAAMRGYENLETMLANGITPIHVFHQGERLYWLDKMIEKTDYIGISPANDLGVPSRRKWIESVYNHLQKKNCQVKTHGFAVWMPRILKDFPWTSCDAATWRLVAAWGKIYYPARGLSNPDYSQLPSTITVSNRRNAKGVGELTDEITQDLENNGYPLEKLQDWAERAKVNVQYFLALEKWLNEQKKNIEYKPALKGFF